MSAHTNSNKRNSGGPKSRHGPPRQRGPESRPSQPKNASPPASAQTSQSNETPLEPKPEPKAQKEYREQRHETQPPAQAMKNQPDSSDDATGSMQPQVANDISPHHEQPISA